MHLSPPPSFYGNAQSLPLLPPSFGAIPQMLRAYCRKGRTPPLLTHFRTDSRDGLTAAAAAAAAAAIPLPLFGLPSAQNGGRGEVYPRRCPAKSPNYHNHSCRIGHRVTVKQGENK